MDLTDICGATAAALQRLDLAALRHRCIDVGHVLDPTRDTGAVVVAIVFAILATAGVLIHRLLNRDDWWIVVLESLEALMFGAAAGYAGVVGGIIIAELAPPLLLGLLFLVLAGVGLLFAIVAAVRGDGDAGWKAFGFLHSLTLIAGLVVMAIFCLAVPGHGPAAGQYHTYLMAAGIGLGLASGVNAIYSCIFRGCFYVVGVVFLIINGTWGFIGNLLGLMTHFASLYSYKDFGRNHAASNRICFVCYENGLSLKSDSAGRFAFTQGAVMSADTSSLRKHEGVHVAQHYLLGPIYPLSHFVWFVAMLIPGLIGAASEKIDVGEGVTRMSYYDNPWEVMAYGLINPSARNTSDALIWGWGAAITVSVIYGLAAIAVFVALLAWRLS